MHHAHGRFPLQDKFPLFTVASPLAESYRDIVYYYYF